MDKIIKYNKRINKLFKKLEKYCNFSLEEKEQLSLEIIKTKKKYREFKYNTNIIHKYLFLTLYTNNIEKFKNLLKKINLDHCLFVCLQVFDDRKKLNIKFEERDIEIIKIVCDKKDFENICPKHFCNIYEIKKLFDYYKDFDDENINSKNNYYSLSSITRIMFYRNNEELFNKFYNFYLNLAIFLANKSELKILNREILIDIYFTFCYNNNYLISSISSIINIFDFEMEINWYFYNKKNIKNILDNFFVDCYPVLTKENKLICSFLLNDFYKIRTLIKSENFKWIMENIYLTEIGSYETKILNIMLSTPIYHENKDNNEKNEILENICKKKNEQLYNKISNKNVILSVFKIYYFSGHEFDFDNFFNFDCKFN